MNLRVVSIVASAVALLSGAVAGASPFPSKLEPTYRAPRTPFGAPDLEGVWTPQTATHLERPDAYKGLLATPAELQARTARLAAAKAPGAAAPRVSGEADGDVGQGASEFVDRNEDLLLIDGGRRTSVITDPADGRIPFTAEGLRKVAELKATPPDRLDDPERRSASERCIASASQAGPPMLSGPDDANLQIIQTRDAVGVLSEMIHDLRRIRLADRRAGAPGGGIGGDSIGRWEGDTLVVETTGQPLITGPREVESSVFWIGPGAKVTERFRRIAPDQILYRFTVEDPKIYSRPWSGEMILRRIDKQIYEYACHEGNYALTNILAGAREKEKREGRTAAATASP